MAEDRASIGVGMAAGREPIARKSLSGGTAFGCDRPQAECVSTHPPEGAAAMLKFVALLSAVVLTLVSPASAVAESSLQLHMTFTQVGAGLNTDGQLVALVNGVLSVRNVGDEPTEALDYATRHAPGVRPRVHSEWSVAGSRVHHAVLVRSRHDGSTELVGSSRGVGYRYLIAENGDAQLVEIERLSAISRDLRNRLDALGGTVLGGGAVAAVIGWLADNPLWDWAIAPMVVGFAILISANIAYDGNFQSMTDDVDSWQAVGSGWGE
jgi:hypothetical protein